MTSYRSVSNEVTDPELYYIIGRLKGLSPIARNRFDEMYHWALCDFALNMALSVMPDGIIVQRCDACYVTNGQKLEPFDPERRDWTDRPQNIPAPELTPQEFAAMVVQECKYAAWWQAHYRGRA